MHDFAPNIVESFRCSLLVYEWWGILKVSRFCRPSKHIILQFSVPQIEYTLEGSSKKGSHVYFLLQVFWVILLFDINVVQMLPW